MLIFQLPSPEGQPCARALFPLSLANMPDKSCGVSTLGVLTCKKGLKALTAQGICENERRRSLHRT